MKIVFILILALVGASCKKAQPITTSEPAKSRVEFPQHFDSAWVMSSGWAGHMGVAIAISGDQYFYWMYSDVGGPGDYPYVGQYSINNETLSLGDPRSLVTERMIDKDDLHTLYSNEWKLIRGRIATNLHAVTDKPDDHARTLILDVQFDPHNPFRNQHNLESEQASSGQPATRPESKSEGGDKPQPEAEGRSR